MTRKPIPYGRQTISGEDIKAVTDVLRSDFLTQGPAIAEFEKAFAAYTGVAYAVAVSSGTAALHLAALALNVTDGYKVITTPITFAATANCIRYCCGTVCFADIDPDCYTLNPDAVVMLIETHPAGTFSGIITVDLAGYPVNMEIFRAIADKYHLWLIEDACHAPGGYFTDTKGRKQYCGNGRYADLAVFSFHPVKHIATGEGGMITTNNGELYRKLLLLRTHGISRDPAMITENHGGWYYEMQELGYNYRLTDIQAALGSSQLKRAGKNLEKRRQIAARYDAAFKNTSVMIPKVSTDVYHAFHLYIIQVEDRLGLYNHLRKNQIFSQVHYIPVHYQPYYKKLGYKKGEWPVAERYYEHCLSLPIFPSLTMKQQEYVIDKVLEFIK
jgi:UDP-4-amino-4,6-dideoxy-N-acetyl-beta-L-altrosamine transaminase